MEESNVRMKYKRKTVFIEAKICVFVEESNLRMKYKKKLFFAVQVQHFLKCNLILELNMI
jgi:hypothetical protein